jgi:hypothetical protein
VPLFSNLLQRSIYTFHFSTLNELPNLGSYSIAADINILASLVIDVDFLTWFGGGFTLGDFAFSCRGLRFSLAIKLLKRTVDNLRSHLERVFASKSQGKLDPKQRHGHS